jgi:hypothetical protein
VVLSAGTKLLVVHRRLFETDERRYFVGVVRAYEAGVAKVEGYSFSWHHVSGKAVRKPEPRTKLISLSSGTLIVYEIPQATDLAALNLRESPDRHVLLSDGEGFELDVTEHLQPPKP